MEVGEESTGYSGASERDMCGSEDRHCPGGVRGRAEACAEAGAETGETVLCWYRHCPGGGRAEVCAEASAETGETGCSEPRGDCSAAWPPLARGSARGDEADGEACAEARLPERLSASGRLHEPRRLQNP